MARKTAKGFEVDRRMTHDDVKSVERMRSRGKCCDYVGSETFHMLHAATGEGSLA